MRLPDWDARLADAVAGAFDMPYAYGEQDCLLWVGKAVEAITGDDLWSEHVGQYDSAAKASRYLRSIGFDSPAAFLDAHFEAVELAYAQRGDLVAYGHDEVPAVCLGDFALAVGEDGERVGLFRVAREDWTKAWRVGEPA